jgi:hypothetical protein
MEIIEIQSYNLNEIDHLRGVGICLNWICIHVVQERDKRLAFVNTVMNVWFR